MTSKKHTYMTKEEVKLPLSSYSWRVKESTKETSKSSGNPMLKLVCELVDEPPMLIDGDEVDVNGLEAVKYVSPLNEKGLRTINDFRESCGFEDKITAADIPNIEAAHFTGRIFTALGSTKETDMEDRESKAPVINKLTGKPIRQSRLEIGRILTRNS